MIRLRRGGNPNVSFKKDVSKTEQIRYSRRGKEGRSEGEKAKKKGSQGARIARKEEKKPQGRRRKIFAFYSGCATGFA